MTSDGVGLVETVTLSEAKTLLLCAAQRQSFLLLSPPGVGKSDMVAQAATEAGLVCRSLLGTQIAPEDVSGVPYIVGERSVFCPPRVLLPESPEPFCLFLDELPACAPDIQKAFYSLLLERRLGEHHLPSGSWVVAAGNRSEDRALVRTISSALVNRVIVLQIRVDVPQWLAWATQNHLRYDVRSYIESDPGALLREVPSMPAPFSTPRAWASLSQALDRLEQAGVLNEEMMLALAEGRISSEDCPLFCGWADMLHNAQTNVKSLGYAGVIGMSIESLEISSRSKQALVAAGFTTLGSIAKRQELEFITLPGFDRARMEELRSELQRYGLRFGMKL